MYSRNKILLFALLFIRSCLTYEIRINQLKTDKENGEGEEEDESEVSFKKYLYHTYLLSISNEQSFLGEGGRWWRCLTGEKDEALRG